MFGDLPDDGIIAFIGGDQFADVILILPGVHLDLQLHAPLVAVDQQHIMGCPELVVQGGIQQDHHHRHHDFDKCQPDNGHHRQHGVADEAQDHIGKDIGNKNGYDLSDDQIHPVQLTKHGTVRILEHQVHQSGIHRHQDILTLIFKVSKGIALLPYQIIDQRHDQDLQQGFHHPDGSLHILIGAAA